MGGVQYSAAYVDPIARKIVSLGFGACFDMRPFSSWVRARPKLGRPSLRQNATQRGRDVKVHRNFGPRADPCAVILVNGLVAIQAGCLD